MPRKCQKASSEHTFLVQFSSVAQSCLTLCDPINCSTPGSPVRHQRRRFLKLMSVESVMPSNHLILRHPLLLPPSVFPSFRVFSSESLLCIRWPRYWSSASASVFPVNIQDWFPLGWTGLISLQSKGLSRVFSNTAVKHKFFSTLSLLYIPTHIHTWLLGKPQLWLDGPLSAK